MFDNAADQQKCLSALRYIDNKGEPTEIYPYNPNGSPGGLTAVTTEDGRFTIMMPHPERVFRTVQMSWHPAGWGEDSPGCACSATRGAGWAEPAVNRRGLLLRPPLALATSTRPPAAATGSDPSTRYPALPAPAGGRLQRPEVIVGVGKDFPGAFRARQFLPADSGDQFEPLLDLFHVLGSLANEAGMRS